MLVKNNNMCLDMFINVHSLVRHISTQHSLMHGYRIPNALSKFHHC